MLPRSTAVQWKWNRFAHDSVPNHWVLGARRAVLDVTSPTNTATVVTRMLCQQWTLTMHARVTVRRRPAFSRSWPNWSVKTHVKESLSADLHCFEVPTTFFLLSVGDSKRGCLGLWRMALHGSLPQIARLPCSLAPRSASRHNPPRCFPRPWDLNPLLTTRSIFWRTSLPFFGCPGSTHFALFLNVSDDNPDLNCRPLLLFFALWRENAVNWKRLNPFYGIFLPTISFGFK